MSLNYYQWVFCGNQDLDLTLTIASTYWETELPTVLWMSWNTLLNILRFSLILVVPFETFKEEMPFPSLNEQTKYQFFLWRHVGEEGLIRRISPTRSPQRVSLLLTYCKFKWEKESFRYYTCHLLYKLQRKQLSKKKKMQKLVYSISISQTIIFLLHLKHVHLPYEIQLSYQGMWTYKVELKELTDCLF